VVAFKSGNIESAAKEFFKSEVTMEILNQGGEEESKGERST